VVTSYKGIQCCGLIWPEGPEKPWCCNFNRLFSIKKKEEIYTFTIKLTFLCVYPVNKLLASHYKSSHWSKVWLASGRASRHKTYQKTICVSRTDRVWMRKSFTVTGCVLLSLVMVACCYCSLFVAAPITVTRCCWSWSLLATARHVHRSVVTRLALNLVDSSINFGDWNYTKLYPFKP